MRILHVNTFGSGGGAAIAMKRLHLALLDSGVDSTVLVSRSDEYYENIIRPTTFYDKSKAIMRPKIESIFNKSSSNYSKYSTTKLSNMALVTRINQVNADIVHLHWINDGFLSITDLKKIKSKIVWSLHDMWPITGGCHYNHKCYNFYNHCGNCHFLKSETPKDSSYYQFASKKKAYKRLAKNLYFVGISSWIASEAKKSGLTRSNHFSHLPNCISSHEFAPIDKKEAKIMLGLPLNKKTILFGAAHPEKETRKGMNLVMEMIKSLNPKDFSFLAIGDISNIQSDLEVQSFGYLRDSLSMRLVYSAADCFVLSSIQENLSNMVLESMACATPVVAFDIGGNRDMISHKVNGYLASAFSIEDLSNGVWEVTGVAHEGYAQKSREKVLTHFRSEHVAAKYKLFYQKVIENG